MKEKKSLWKELNEDFKNGKDGWVLLILSLTAVASGYVNPFLMFSFENEIADIIRRTIGAIFQITIVAIEAYCLYKEIKRVIAVERAEARQEGIDSVSASVAEEKANEKEGEVIAEKEKISEDK